MSDVPRSSITNIKDGQDPLCNPDFVEQHRGEFAAYVAGIFQTVQPTQDEALSVAAMCASPGKEIVTKQIGVDESLENQMVSEVNMSLVSCIKKYIQIALQSWGEWLNGNIESESGYLFTVDIDWLNTYVFISELAGGKKSYFRIWWGSMVEYLTKAWDNTSLEEKKEMIDGIQKIIDKYKSS